MIFVNCSWDSSEGGLHQTLGFLLKFLSSLLVAFVVGFVDAFKGSSLFWQMTLKKVAKMSASISCAKKTSFDILVSFKLGTDPRTRTSTLALHLKTDALRRFVWYMGQKHQVSQNTPVKANQNPMTTAGFFTAQNASGAAFSLLRHRRHRVHHRATRGQWTLWLYCRR